MLKAAPKMIALSSALAVVLATGCASISKEQLDEVRSMAENAISKSDSASATASKALETAESAMSKAEAAQRSADDAQACCNANTQKIDRMFEKAMTK